MDTKIIFIYCFCDDLLTSLKIKNDPQCKMNFAEIMTLAITSAFFFHGDFSFTRDFLSDYGYIANMLSKSRLNRRFHSIDISIWELAFSFLSRAFQAEEKDLEYLVDSFPVEVCMNARSYRSKLLNGKEFIGFCKAKKKFYYGVKVHMITNSCGKPVEFLITAASMSDIKALKMMNMDIPINSTIYADKAYNDYKFEDELKDLNLINLIAQRKPNLKRQHSLCMQYLQSYKRKTIETAFSNIFRLFPRKIHAVTKKGFILKIILFIIAFAIKHVC